MTGFRIRDIGTLAMGLAIAVSVATPADARRGGSFGSRGARTHAAPAATPTAPNQAAPVQRSMTESPKAASSSPAAMRGQATKAPGSRFGGLAGGLLGGLLMGGLIGALLGGGLGALGGSGMLMALLQIAMFGGLLWLILRMFRRKANPTPAYAGNVSSFAGHGYADQTARPAGPAPAPLPTQDIPITHSDQAAFERLLGDVQDAFAREDYARLRTLTTPEVMSYFAEELSQNATGGRRNEVSGTRLIQADVAEAWREASTDYATIAMRYESIDVMRDRVTGAVIEGNPDVPTETTELWTFTRVGADDWRLSAVQAAG